MISDKGEKKVISREIAFLVRVLKEKARLQKEQVFFQFTVIGPLLKLRLYEWASK